MLRQKTQGRELMIGKIRSVRKILTVMMAFLVFCGSSLCVSVAEALPDLSVSGSVLVTLETSDGTKAPGGTLTLYKVADVVWDSGSMVYKKTEPFEEYGGDLDINNGDLAAALLSYADLNSVEGTAYKISSDGRAEMKGLSMGLYLVGQTEASTGFYKISPFLVGLPLEGENGWDYDIDAYPKMERVEKIENTTDTSDTEPEPTDAMSGESPKTGETDESIKTDESIEADESIETDESIEINESDGSAENSAVETADMTNIDLWGRLLLVSGFALASLLIYRMNRKKSGRRA